MNAQTPTLPGSPQDMQTSPQKVSQQTPSTQKPDRHSAGDMHGPGSAMTQ
ncbi:MAG: hypothetical protein U0441_24405 [Polyangiaceae bacterium]